VKYGQGLGVAGAYLENLNFHCSCSNKKTKKNPESGLPYSYMQALAWQRANLNSVFFRWVNPFHCSRFHRDLTSPGLLY